MRLGRAWIVSPRSEGFTLFEMLLTLALAAALTMLVVPNFGPAIDSARLKSASRNIASALRQTRTLAIKQRRDVRLTLDIHQHVYRISGESRVFRLPEEVELKLFTADSEIIDQGRGSVRFFPDGSSTGGRVTLMAGERKRIVDVNWLTGHVTLRENES